MRHMALLFIDNDLVSFTKASFTLLVRETSKAHLAELWYVQKDKPISTRTSSSTLTFINNIKYYLNVRSVPSDNTEESARQREAAHFARSCLAFCFDSIQKGPDCASLFSDVCADDTGATVERAELARALAPLDIQVIQWDTEASPVRKALLFPPHSNQTGRHDGPCVLLQFIR